MSPRPIAPNAAIQRLIDEGYEVEIRHQHLLVHAVPYVTPKGEVDIGILVCSDVDPQPRDHTAWFRGQMPCNSNGQPLCQLVNKSDEKLLFDDFRVQHYLSNKPEGITKFASHYEKVVHYVDLLTAQARVINPDADARTGKAIRSWDENSVFRYPDSASARAGIMAISEKLAVMRRIAIIGLGGTGGYILDQMVKTPVPEIHTFDGDDLKCHNAFRMPGAISLPELEQQPKKVEHFSRLYDRFRTGIVPHAYYVDATNVSELAGFDFVFVAVDDGPSRKLISDYLRKVAIPFIDVGLGLEVEEQSLSLTGLCRVTLGTPKKHDHLDSQALLPVGDDKGDAVYRSNIQVADMNALNAALAVIRWKQYCGFYADTEQAHYLSYSLGLQSLARGESVVG